MNALTVATIPADRDRALALLTALGGVGEAAVLTIPGEPVPKPRARHGHGQTFASAKQRDAEAVVGMALRGAFDRPLDGNVALVSLFFRSSRQRVDRDNLDKLVCDAANGILVADDCQITGGAQLLELDRDNPRTVLAVAGHESTLTR